MEKVVTKEVPVPYEVKAVPEVVQVTKEVPVDRIVEVFLMLAFFLGQFL